MIQRSNDDFAADRSSGAWGLHCTAGAGYRESPAQTHVGTLRSSRGAFGLSVIAVRSFWAAYLRLSANKNEPYQGRIPGSTGVLCGLGTTLTFLAPWKQSLEAGGSGANQPCDPFWSVHKMPRATTAAVSMDPGERAGGLVPLSKTRSAQNLFATTRAIVRRSAGSPQQGREA
jgi:hypothetical protein